MLVIEADRALTTRLAHFFGAQGHIVETAPDQASAIRKIEQHSFEIVIADSKTVGAGMEGLLLALASRTSHSVTIVMCEPERIDEAIHAIREGAADFIQKPVNLAALDIKVSKGIELMRLAHERQVLRGDQDFIYRTTNFVGQSPAIRKVLDLVEKVAKSSSSVVLLGETGTGKELLAGAIHFNSLRSAHAFVKVNCATLPDTLLESELFGHERGAFTGAEKTRIGRFEQANGGTIFLDEIADISPPIQSKLLRVLQEKEFERLGSNRTISVDVRVISATNKDLSREIEAGRFRTDLFYRLNVVSIPIPPLREREGDVGLLAMHFLRKFATDMKKKVTEIDAEAMRFLIEYWWPGNIRELKNTIERAVIMADSDTITQADISLPFLRPGPPEAPSPDGFPPAGMKWEEMEKGLIVKALEKGGWIQKEAAKILGLSTRVLNYKIKKFGITHPSWRQNR